MGKPKDAALSQRALHEMFEYRDGVLYWKPKPAGTVDGNGYMQTGIKGKYFKNHRIIFLMHHGHLPDLIDHIDGNKRNNRIENLREASNSQNNYNKRLQKNNRSGVKGVHWVERFKKWRVRIGVDGKDLHVGYFEKYEDAVFAATKARMDNHRLFARSK
jgi:hypothetical protein